MALNDMNGDGSETEDKCLEPDIIAQGNILKGFAESLETRELINSLGFVYEDLILRETAIEKFKGVSCPF